MKVYLSTTEAAEMAETTPTTIHNRCFHQPKIGRKVGIGDHARIRIGPDALAETLKGQPITRAR
jgi:hypothetical protein